jgi:hypothetical protein
MADRRITSRTKVYITRIGLRDWVVAVDSQKAALKAWDVHRNLFAEGAARVTNDPVHIELAMRMPGVPVAAPGRVVETEGAPVRARRGKTKPESSPSNVVRFPGERRSAPAAPPPKAQPDRSKLDAAERELRAYERDVVKERAAIEKQLRTVQTELEAFDAEAGRRRERLEKRIAREKAALDG